MNKQEIYDLLIQKNIPHEITEHEAVYNMAQVAMIELPYPEAEAKNLFVRDDYVRTDILQNTDTINCTQEMFAGDALMIGNLRSTKVRLVTPAGLGVEMDYSGYPVMAFWTPPAKNAPFVCLEPWHGLPANTFESGEFSEKAFAIGLAPGEEKALSYSVKLI